MNIKRIIKKVNLEEKISSFAKIIPLSVSIKDKNGKEVLYFSNIEKEPKFCYSIEFNDEISGTLYISEDGDSAEYVLKIIIDSFAKQNQITEITNETLTLYGEINLFHDLSTIINKQPNLDKRLDSLLEKCVTYNQADNASIWIIKGDILECLYYKGNKPQITFKLGEGFIGKVAQSGNGEMLNCPIRDVRWSGEISKKTSIIGASLSASEMNLGILNISRYNGVPFTAKNLKFANTFAHITSVELEIDRLFEEVRRETVMRTNLSRFLSPNVVDLFAGEANEVSLGSETRIITILFLDIVNFTSISERLDSKIIVEMLNENFTAMTDVVFKYDGTLDKFIGDALMAIFGAPKSLDDHALFAVKAGLLMQKKNQEILEKRRKEKKPHFRIRIGINTGIATVGNIGSPNRLDYTAIGDNVNIASRIENAASPGEVLIGESTYERTKGFFKIEEMKPIAVKGKDNLLKVYKVLE